MIHDKTKQTNQAQLERYVSNFLDLDKINI